MSVFLRLIRGSRVTFSQRPGYSPVILGGLRKSIGSGRHFAQAARQEEEEEEVEFDLRRLPADYDPATFNPKDHRSPPTERVWRLVDEMSGLTLVEVSLLSKIIMSKMGMGPMPMVGSMKPGAAGMSGGSAKEEKKVEKTAFELKLESFEAASKLKIIKEIRSVTELGLKEAKELVEKTPAVFKKGVSKEEAEQIVEKLKAIGAKVVME